MYSPILDSITLQLDLEKITDFNNPFNEQEVNRIGGRNLEGIDNMFQSMAVGYYESAYVYSDFILLNQSAMEFGILAVLNNIIIGIELTLKASLSSFDQFNSDEWMFNEPIITEGHNLNRLINKIRDGAKEGKVTPSSDKDFEWINKRLKIIEDFVEFCSNQGIDFESTRYPTNKKGEAKKYVDEPVHFNISLLKSWIEILYMVSNDLFIVFDILNDKRSFYSSILNEGDK